MSLELLPSAWRWWQPITFGFLAGAGYTLWQLAAPTVQGLIGHVLH